MQRRVMSLAGFVVLIAVGALLALSASAQSTPARTPARILDAGIGLPEPTVIGGSPVSEGEFPWLASVQITNNPFFQGHLCGGALVAPEWVLTAAHCVTDLFEPGVIDPSNVLVQLGAVSLSDEDGELLAVDEVIVYPLYNLFHFSDGDAALLHLAEPSAQAPIALARQADAARFAPGVTAIVAGWGNRSLPAQTYPDNAYKVDVPIVANDVCADAYRLGITEGMICAGQAEGGVDSCQGDSGGPLTVPDGAGGHLHVGIVSFGAGCAYPDRYGVYTRIPTFTGWIDAHIQAAPLPELSVGPTGEFTGGANEPLSFSLALANTGNQPLTNIEASLGVPAGVEHVESLDGGVFADGAVTWSVAGTLDPGQVAIVSTVLRSTEGITITEFSAAASAGGAPVDGVRRSPMNTYVDEPVLFSSLQGPSPVLAGSIITQTLVVENYGEGPGATATNLRLSYTLPEGVSYRSGGSISGDTVSWEIPELPSGERVARQIVLQVTTPPEVDPEGRPFFSSTSFSLTAAGGGFVDNGIYALQSIWVVPGSLTLDLEGPARADLDAAVAYTLTVGNPTFVPVVGVEVRLRLPDGVELEPGSGGSVSGGVVTWRQDSLPPGAAATFNFSLRSHGSITLDDYHVLATSPEQDAEARLIGDEAVTTQIGEIYLPLLGR